MEKTPQADYLRQMIGFAAQRLMVLDIERRTARPMANVRPIVDWATRAGTVELRIPNLRKGSYFPSFLEPRRMAEKAIAAAVREAIEYHVKMTRLSIAR
jgi:putative transposase